MNPFKFPEKLRGRGEDTPLYPVGTLQESKDFKWGWHDDMGLIRALPPVKGAGQKLSLKTESLYKRGGVRGNDGE